MTFNAYAKQIDNADRGRGKASGAFDRTEFAAKKGARARRRRTSPHFSVQRCQELHEIPLGPPRQTQLDELLFEDVVLAPCDA
jgi:hypothetical protein